MGEQVDHDVNDHFRAGMSNTQRATAKALMRPVLGLPAGDEDLIIQAVNRLDAYVQSIPEEGAAAQVMQMFSVIRAKSIIENLHNPADLNGPEMDKFVRELFSPEHTFLGDVVDMLVGPLTGFSVRDIAKSLREMLSLAYYSNPNTDGFTGYTPLWDRDDIWQRLDVKRDLDADPSLKPQPKDQQVDVRAICRAHTFEMPSDQKFFSGSGGKRVAVIGSGAGGAVTAAHLAQQGFDVAIFEAGPQIKHHDYPADTLEGMSLLFESGILTTSKDLDMHLLRARVVGGGTVLTSGMSIKMFDSTRNRWSERGGMNLDAGELDAAFESVKDAIALHPLDPGMTTQPGRLWKRGADRVNEAAGRVLYDLRVPLVNTQTKKGNNPRLEGLDRTVGDTCVGCGLCNYGCRFGHKLSVDVTYIPDALAAGARLHPNCPVDRLSAEYDPKTRSVRVTHLFLKNTAARVAVDHVVLAAGAVGTPALLLRSAQYDPDFRVLPGMHDRREATVGSHLAFNYGTAVVAEFKDIPDPSGEMGIQINYVGHPMQDESFHLETSGVKPEVSARVDERFVLENAFLPPGLMANTIPGVGADHRSWMSNYRKLGLAVNTIGAPAVGTVDRKRRVKYSIDDNQLGVIRESLAIVIHQYLHADAVKIGLAGIRGYDDSKNWFTQKDRGLTEAQIVARLEQMVDRADKVMVSSAHPQGGMRMHVDPAHGVVDSDFRVHGTANLFVSDASVFPESITVNPQWSVMAVAKVGAARIAAQLG